jgi:hypothetical protein
LLLDVDAEAFAQSLQAEQLAAKLVQLLAPPAAARCPLKTNYGDRKNARQ